MLIIYLLLNYIHVNYIHVNYILVTPTDRPKSVRNRCVIEVFGGVCVLSFVFRIFCWYRGFCHRTGSDLLLFHFKYFIFNVK